LVAAAVWILTLAVIAGVVLALWHLRATDAPSRPPLLAGIAHGVIGTVGLVLLLIALRGPPRAVEAGAGSFGPTAAVLFAAAVLIGIVILFVRQKAVLISIHAGLAVTGYVLLLAWDSLG
jgi:hypothetical protein